MKKLIKKIGNSLGIMFNVEEQKIYHIGVGDIIEIQKFKFINKRGKNKHWTFTDGRFIKVQVCPKADKELSS